METRFERVDSEIRSTGALLLTIGERLLHSPEDVSVILADGTEVPPESKGDGSLGIEAELPTKERLRDLLVEWRAAKAKTPA